MSRLTSRLTKTDRLIASVKRRIEICRLRIERRERNPALAQYAAGQLGPLLLHLKELTTYRRRLATAAELVEAFAATEDTMRLRRPQLPPYIR